MVQLIQMRQRIAAIETIKKITHAMRLVAMSTHTRLKNKEEPLQYYKSAISQLFNKVKSTIPEWKNETLNPSTSSGHTLIIIIGSQKGLCGSFNTMLFNFFDRYRKEHIHGAVDIITLGKRATSYAQDRHLGNIVKSYMDLSANNLLTISYELTNTVINSPKPYHRVLIVSNIIKNFFVQKPQVFTLVPFEEPAVSSNQQLPLELEDYIWEQSAQEVLDVLIYQCVNANIQHLLFQSLLAEHAARFISMDNATRNAQNLLDETKLGYNKLRQAKITKELAELSGELKQF